MDSTNEKRKHNKNIILIFLTIIFFAFSVGMWSTFSPIWLEDNNIITKNITLLISFASFVAGIFASFSCKIIKNLNITKLVKVFFVFKVIFQFILIFLYQGDATNIIYIFFVLDLIITNLITFSMYPLLTQLKKSDRLYSKRKLAEYLFTDLGILLSTLFIINFVHFNINTNTILIYSTLFLFIATLLIFFVNNKSKQEVFYFKELFKDKILNIYLVYYFVGNISYSCVLAVPILLFKDTLGFSIDIASLLIVAICIVADIIGYLTLFKLQPKNDYITFFLKFGMRFLVYLAVAISNNFIVAVFAVIYSLLVSRSYENVSDGVYLNRLSKEKLFAFSNIRYGLGKIGSAIGTLIYGFTLFMDLRFIFLSSCIFLVLQLLFGNWLIYLRKKELNK